MFKKYILLYFKNNRNGFFNYVNELNTLNNKELISLEML